MGDSGGRRPILEVVIFIFVLHNLVLATHALNHEGKALLRFKERLKKDPFGALSSWEDSSFGTHHCSWFGVDCVDGHVVSLTLKDLCLEGTLVPELGNLAHIKLIILRNNSFSGVVLGEIGALKELEVLDLGYNNFSGTLPDEWGNSISILLLDNNGVFCQVSPELEQLMVISEVQVDESQLSAVDEGSQRNVKLKPSCAAKTLHSAMMSRGLQEQDPLVSRVVRRSPPPSRKQKEDRPDTGSPPTTQPTPPPSSPPPPPPQPPLPPPPPSSSSATNSSSGSTSAKDKQSSKTTVIISASVGAFIVLCLMIGLIMWRSKTISTVGPWRTGLSGQLRKSLVSSGLPMLKRLELEAACEDFSNVIGSTSTGTLYKGTLSSGAEIAVLSHAVKDSKNWSMNMESQFRDKVNSLSELNHKNFLNLLGYCEEDLPFTRMLVFEYAPSGTLFEHLHVRESEHLDWTMRLRAAMGIAYCLDHMHKLTPRTIHENLTTYAIVLTEDYAAKISDFGMWNEVSLAGREDQIIIDSISSPETSPQDNVYSFGLILLEMMTGKAPFSWSTGLLNEWASDYLTPETPLKDFVDPVLRHFDVDQLERIGNVIKSCTFSDPEERPGMGEVAHRLKEITNVAPDAAAPRLSPMWWAELELMSPRPDNQVASSL